MACASDLDELINCQICFELFVDPQSLICRHVFCKKCVNRIKDVTKYSQKIICPVCKVQCRVSDIKPDYRTVFMVDSYLTNVTKEASVTEAKDNLISKCEECEQESKEISHKCDNCDLLLCETCVRSHLYGYFDEGVGHTVNAISAIAAYARTEINTALTDLEAQKEALATRLSNKQQELDHIKQKSDNAIISITKEENSLIAKIQSHHDNLRKEVEKRKVKHVKESKHEFKNTKVYYHDVNDKELLLNSWVSNRSDIEIVNTMEQIQKKLKTIKKKFIKIQQSPTSAENFTVKVIPDNDWNGSTKLVFSTHPTVDGEEIDDYTTAEHRETSLEYDEDPVEEYLEEDEEDLAEYPNELEENPVEDEEDLVEVGDVRVEYRNFEDYEDLVEELDVI